MTLTKPKAAMKDKPSPKASYKQTNDSVRNSATTMLCCELCWNFIAIFSTKILSTDLIRDFNKLFHFICTFD
jgi:hypothetical protein